MKSLSSINEKLARLDGFENIDTYIDRSLFGKSTVKGTKDNSGESDDLLGRQLIEIPDYENSYDAVLKVLQGQSFIFKEQVIANLFCVLRSNLVYEAHSMILDFSPSEICKAIIKTVENDCMKFIK